MWYKTDPDKLKICKKQLNNQSFLSVSSYTITVDFSDN